MLTISRRILRLPSLASKARKVLAEWQTLKGEINIHMLLFGKICLVQIALFCPLYYVKYKTFLGKVSLFLKKKSITSFLIYDSHSRIFIAM